MIDFLRKLLGIERRATMIDYHRIQAEFQLWNAEEDRLFDIWHRENKHRFPLGRFYMTEADKAAGNGFDMPEMQEKHYMEFSEYRRANWKSSVPYERK